MRSWKQFVLDVTNSSLGPFTFHRMSTSMPPKIKGRAGRRKPAEKGAKPAKVSEGSATSVSLQFAVDLSPSRLRSASHSFHQSDASVALSAPPPHPAILSTVWLPFNLLRAAADFKQTSQQPEPTASIDIASFPSLFSLIIRYSCTSTLATLLQCSQATFKQASHMLYRELRITLPQLAAMIETGRGPLKKGVISGALGRSFSPYCRQ